MLIRFAFLFVCVAYTLSHPVFEEVLQEEPAPFQESLQEDPQNLVLHRPESPIRTIRLRRSPFREGEPQYGQNPNKNQNQKTWEINPDLSRDQRGNTRGKVEIQRHGDNHDINAGYEQVFRGPDKHSETWHIGGKFGW